MKEIINDWCKFCEGLEIYDKSHFYTLFWVDNIDKDDLNTIFKYFPNSNELVNLMTDYLFGEKIINNPSSDFLIELVTNDIIEKTSLTDNLTYITNYPIQFEKDYNFVTKRIDSDEYYEYYDTISDILTDKWIIEDKKAFALYEALYGLTKNYEIVWHLFSPLFDTEINLKNYFALSVLGGVYTIYNKKILVSKATQ